LSTTVNKEAETGKVARTEPRSRKYTEAQIQRVLTEVAACAGNSGLAAKHLEEDGLSIPLRTIQYWKADLHADKYQAIREIALPAIRRQAADMHMASARRRMELADELADALKAKKGELEAKDLSTALRNVDVGSAVHTDKATQLNEVEQPRPAQNFGNMLREFKQMTGIDISLKVPEPEEPVQEAEVVEEKP
jgi:hypothetical protein